ncbi:MAG: DUF2079 domain-containing protein [Chloroflexota bacterium]|nr:DUF2079 domain-containing protein [Chloroflexota bacterium]
MSAALALPVWTPSGQTAQSSRVNEWGPWFCLGLMVIGFAVVLGWLSVARHLAYQSHAFDLGNMDQAAWNTLHGNLLHFSDMAVGRRVLTSRFAIHVEPMLIVLSALYLVHSGPETLLVAQAVIVSVGAVPAYLLARRALGRVWLALVFPAAYLLHPSLQNAVLDDFHPVVLSACFLLWALYFAYCRWMPGYAVAAGLSMSTKEEIGLLVAGIGLWLLLRGRMYAGWMSIICGLGWFGFSLLVLIPSFNPAGHSPYLSRYAYLGHGVGGVVVAVWHHPGVIIHVLSSESRLAYLGYLMHPLGFVSLLGLPIMLLAVPSLLINMLSKDPRMYSGFYQYSAEILPFVIASAALGAGFVSRCFARLAGSTSRWLPALLCALLLVTAGFDSRRYGFSPLAAGYGAPSAGAHQALENRLLRSIPPRAVVAAADEIEPHLSDRPWVYLLPTIHPRNAPAARYLALDASIPSLPVTPRVLHSTAVAALHSGYGIVQAQDGVLVAERGGKRRRFPSDFYAFAFRHDGTMTRTAVHWAALSLVGFVVHPRGGSLNRSRPAVGLETYWRVAQGLSSSAAIRFLVSPVYRGTHPGFSSRWLVSTDSPTWDWLPLRAWPAGRTIRAESLPFSPSLASAGYVDVAVDVVGLGQARQFGRGSTVRGMPSAVRIATIGIEP